MPLTIIQCDAAGPAAPPPPNPIALALPVRLAQLQEEQAGGLGSEPSQLGLEQPSSKLMGIGKIKHPASFESGGMTLRCVFCP